MCFLHLCQLEYDREKNNKKFNSWYCVEEGRDPVGCESQNHAATDAVGCQPWDTPFTTPLDDTLIFLIY